MRCCARCATCAWQPHPGGRRLHAAGPRSPAIKFVADPVRPRRPRSAGARHYCRIDACAALRIPVPGGVSPSGACLRSWRRVAVTPQTARRPRFERGAGGFGAASKASGAGHVPFVPLSGGAQKYSTTAAGLREPIVSSGRPRRGEGRGGRPVLPICILSPFAATRAPRRLCSAKSTLLPARAVSPFAGKDSRDSVPANGPINDNWLSE